MSQELNEFLNQLSAIRDNDLVSCYVPSLAKECLFLPLTMRQQKDLLKSVGDSAINIINFNKVLLEIIQDNLVDKTVELNSVDRYSILIALRNASLGDEYSYNDQTYNLSELISSNPSKLCSLTKALVIKGIKINLECPTIKKDIDFLNYSVTDLKKTKTTEDDGSNTVAIMYVLELIKFITNISFKDIDVDFENLTIADKKNIIDNLPVQVIQQITNFISSVRKYESQFITFADGTTVQFNTLFFPTD